MAEESEKDELDELFVNEKEVIDKKFLRRILENYVILYTSGRFTYNENFWNQTNSNKIIIYLLIRKAQAIKNIGNLKHESASLSEISNAINLPAKSISARLSELRNLIAKDENGYYIPNHNLSRLSFLEEISTKKYKKIIKGTKVKKEKMTELYLSEQQLKELKPYYERINPKNGQLVVLVLSNFLRESIRKENFHEGDIDYLYRKLVSVKVRVPRIRNIRQTMQNLASPSQKMEWLENKNGIFNISTAGILYFNELLKKQ